jgi:Rrf2 family protein
MTVSVKAGYALQAILDLAMRPAGEPVRIADIARRQKIPQKFLELILASLKQGGFVESRRGAEGGYLLARAPETITVGQVVRHVDGAKGADGNRAEGETAFSDMWRRIDQAVSCILDSTNFAELARTWQDRQSKYIPNWDI